MGLWMKSQAWDFVALGHCSQGLCSSGGSCISPGSGSCCCLGTTPAQRLVTDLSLILHHWRLWENRESSARHLDTSISPEHIRQCCWHNLNGASQPDLSNNVALNNLLPRLLGIQVLEGEAGRLQSSRLFPVQGPPSKISLNILAFASSHHA